MALIQRFAGPVLVTTLMRLLHATEQLLVSRFSATSRVSSAQPIT